MGLLAKVDVLVRQAIRGWLALPHDTPLGYFYAAVGEDGLGVMCLRTAIPAMQVRRLVRLSESASQTIQQAAACRLIVSLLTRARGCCRYRNCDIGSKSLGDKFWQYNLHRSVDGHALKDTNQAPFAQHWIAEGSKLLPGRAFVDVVKLRINALPTLTRLRRGRARSDASVNSRAGCGVRETIGHILQECYRTDAARVQRHNSILNYLAGRLRQLDWSVLVEPHYKTSVGTRIPDLVVRSGAQSAVIDVQVVGTNWTLECSHTHKVAYYTLPDMLGLIQGRNTSPPLFLSATLNLRGVWFGGSVAALRDLGLTQNDFKLMTVRCLQGGVRGFKHHQASTSVARRPLFRDLATSVATS